MNHLFFRTYNLITRTSCYKNVILQSKVLFANRPEQKKLRKNLISKGENQCIICERKFPLCLLDAAHIKPRMILTTLEKKNIYNVEFMCKCCHSLFDNGLVSIYKGEIHISNDLEQYDFFDITRKERKIYNNQNSLYFDFHYHNIYKK